jgi:uncharacterized Zn-finger protein
MACYSDNSISMCIIVVVDIDFVCQGQPTTYLHWRIVLPLRTPCYLAGGGKVERKFEGG